MVIVQNTLTLAAYELAMPTAGCAYALGADYIEPDLVSTKDGNILEFIFPELCRRLICHSDRLLLLSGQGLVDSTSDQSSVPSHSKRPPPPRCHRR